MRELCDYYISSIRNGLKINGLTFYELFPFCSFNKDQSTVSCVRTALSVSIKFLQLCSKYDCPPSVYYKIIKDFYADKELDSLNRWYSKMEENSSILPLSQQVYEYDLFDLDFDSDSVSRFAASLDMDVQSVMYAAVHPEESQVLVWDSLLASKIRRDNIKHKELNDINDILYASYKI